MEVKPEIHNEIISTAERLIHYNNLLIEQCNSWLPEDEGNRIIEARFLEQIRRKKREKRKKAFAKIVSCFRFNRKFEI